MNLTKQNTEPLFFEDFINNFFGVNISNQIPPYNIISCDKEFLIEFSVAGCDKKDFSIEIKENILRVTKIIGNVQKDENIFYKRQFNYSQFEKIFKIPDEVNFEKINSNYENGILKIILPKNIGLKRNKIKSIKIN